MKELEAVAKENGTFPIILTYKDDQGDPVTPNNMAWTLTDLDGNVINSRADVAITSLSTSNTVILQGDDLALLDGNEYEWRVLSVEGDYDSSLGNQLPVTDQVKFKVENIVGI